MVFSQNLLGLQAVYPVMTSHYVPGLHLEFARFLGKTGHFKLNFSIENSRFNQFLYQAFIFTSCIMSVQYTKGYFVHWVDKMSTGGGGDTLSTPGSV